jgi:hypothetical protein
MTGRCARECPSRACHFPISPLHNRLGTDVRDAPCYSGTVIRRAVLLAILALVLELLLRSFWPFLRAVAASPRNLIERGTLEFVLALVSPITLVLFLVALYQELTGHASASRRQVWALAAASGMIVRVGFLAGQLHANAVALSSLPPQIRAQLPAATFDVPGQWMHAIFWSIIPAVIWFGFLLVFWRDVALLGREWTRRLALVLCLITTAQAVNEISRILSGLHRYHANWPGLAVSLLVTQAQTQDRNAALTLAVGLITQCDSVHAGAMQLSGTAKSYCFIGPTIFDERDIATAELDQAAYHKSIVRLTLNDDAAQRFKQLTGANIGNEVGMAVNGQLVSVAMIQARIDQVVGITGLAHDVADMVVETFQRRRPVFTFWHLVILPALSTGWEILQAVILGAAPAALPWFLFSVWRTRAAPESAPGTAAL